MAVHSEYTKHHPIINAEQVNLMVSIKLFGTEAFATGAVPGTEHEPRTSSRCPVDSPDGKGPNLRLLLVDTGRSGTMRNWTFATGPFNVKSVAVRVLGGEPPNRPPGSIHQAQKLCESVRLSAEVRRVILKRALCRRF